QLGKWRRPGQQQNRNCHDTTGGSRSQKSFHCRHIIYTSPRQHNCHNRRRTRPLSRFVRLCRDNPEKKSFNNATIGRSVTLLETCASTLVISAVAVFAAPSLIKARENYQLDATARQVAGKMQWTRIKAISRNRDCRIRVDSQTSYVIECEDPFW